jgi:cytochrome c oxidase assembly protein subunit 11
MPPIPEPQPPRKGNRFIALICAGAVALMVGGAYAAVPFYRAFCQATGFNGTVRRAEAPPGQVLNRKVTVTFDANVRGLPWDFAPEQTSQTVNIGAPSIVYFKVTNHGATPMTGRAAYNVVPEVAGAYFLKTRCFCFSDQTIPAGKTVEFPVVYFVEPKFASDPDTRTFQDITLSYTFFPAPDAKKAG